MGNCIKKQYLLRRGSRDLVGDGGRGGCWMVSWRLLLTWGIAEIRRPLRWEEIWSNVSAIGPSSARASIENEVVLDAWETRDEDEGLPPENTGGVELEFKEELTWGPQDFVPLLTQRWCSSWWCYQWISLGKIQWVDQRDWNSEGPEEMSMTSW